MHERHIKDLVSKRESYAYRLTKARNQCLECNAHNKSLLSYVKQKGCVLKFDTTNVQLIMKINLELEFTLKHA